MNEGLLLITPLCMHLLRSAVQQTNFNFISLSEISCYVQRKCLALRQERNVLATNRKTGDGTDDPDPDRSQLASVVDRPNIANVITKSVAARDHLLTIALNIHPVESMREVDQPLRLIDPLHRKDIDPTNVVHMNEEGDVHHHRQNHQQQHLRIPNIHRHLLLK